MVLIANLFLSVYVALNFVVCVFIYFTVKFIRNAKIYYLRNVIINRLLYLSCCVPLFAKENGRGK